MPAPMLLVLAAGLGRRFGGLKQLEPMGSRGETLLDYAVFDAQRAGFERVVFVVSPPMLEAFQARVQARFGRQLQVECVDQRVDDLPPGTYAPSARKRPWGTLHALLAARERLTQPFAVINADDFYGREAYQLMATWLTAVDTLADPHRCCLVAYRLDHTLSGSGGVNRGIVQCQGDRLLSVQEHREIVAEAPAGQELKRVDAERATDAEPAIACSGLRLDGRRVPLAGDAVASMNFWGFSPGLVRGLQQHFAEFLHAQGHDPEAECYIPSAVDALLRTGQAACTLLPTRAQWFGVTHALDKPAVVARLQGLIGDGTYPAPLWPCHTEEPCP